MQHPFPGLIIIRNEAVIVSANVISVNIATNNITRFSAKNRFKRISLNHSVHSREQPTGHKTKGFNAALIRF
jgi:hypothetical protein